MNQRSLAAVLVSATLPATAAITVIARTPPAAPPPAPAAADPAETPNLSHSRHLHAHNPKHPAAHEPARFTTSRRDAIRLPLPAEKDAFTFAVFGDRTGGPADGVNVLADAVRDVNLLEPDLVMTVGDLVQGYNEDPEYAVQAREYKAIMNRLTPPWFPVAGNHDVYWRDKDKSGDRKPAGENEAKYEKHFGPLWYAFEHKNAWFVVLFSDEGDPDTGEKGFNVPKRQQMSDAQFAWLKETLARARGADHVFVFLHHPRWLGSRSKHEGYGDAWARVHEELVKAGNVTAVFGGHVHRMRHDAKDGIEYVTLATTGGGLRESNAPAGWLHHYHLVTVRKAQVAMAAFPVGQAVDVREMTGDLTDQTGKLAAADPAFDAPVEVRADGSADSVVHVRVANPTSRPVEYTLAPDSRDSRWIADPDHQHTTVRPGESATIAFRVRRAAGTVDESFRPLELVAGADYLAPGYRYAIPERRLAFPLSVAAATTRPMVLALDGASAPGVPARAVRLPGKQFTLEGRFRARALKPRQGLFGKMQTSGYGVVLRDGRPAANVYLGDKYLVARAPRAGAPLQTNRWYHVAQVFDGSELRLYIDGRLVARAEGGDRAGDFKDNDLPLIVGGDVGNRGAVIDALDGEIDAVRLSSTARYAGERFTPAERHAPDEHTLLLLNFDFPVGPYLHDESPRRRMLPTTRPGPRLAVPTPDAAR